MNKKFSQILIFATSIGFSVPSYSIGPESMEDLLYTTLRVTCKKFNSSTPFSVGTGYIYDFLEKDPDVAEYNNGKYSVIPTAQFVRKPYLVTNKHVIEGADSIELMFHLTKDGKVPVGTYKIPVGKTVNLQGVAPIEGLFCKLQNVDICAFALSDCIRYVEDNLNRPREKEYMRSYKIYEAEKIKQPNDYTPPPLKPEKLSVFYKSLSKKNLVNFEAEEAIQDIVMVGYPFGLANESTNLPIIRKGITASSIKHDFQYTQVLPVSPDILIDAACFPGSSGSPVFIYQADGNKRKPFKAKLLGTNYSTFNANNIQSTPIPTKQELVPSNLALVIKSTVLQKFNKLCNSPDSQTQEMIEMNHHNLSVRKQCSLLEVNRSTLYYRGTDRAIDAQLANEIHEIWLEMPFYGYRRITAELRRRGYVINQKRVIRLMKEMNIQALYPRPRTTIKAAKDPIYPYLSKDIEIARPNQAWATDITYVKMPVGFAYLVALIDVHSRYVLSWRLANTMDTHFCLEMLEEALRKYPHPEILNTDQGSQFTSHEWTRRVKEAGIQISMDGKDDGWITSS